MPNFYCYSDITIRWVFIKIMSNYVLKLFYDILENRSNITTEWIKRIPKIKTLPYTLVYDINNDSWKIFFKKAHYPNW